MGFVHVDMLVGEEIFGTGTGPLEETGDHSTRSWLCERVLSRQKTGEHSTPSWLCERVLSRQEVGAAPLSPSMPTYTGTVARIMGLGGFKVKYMIRNGESRPEILELYAGSVLGLPWDTSNDMLRLSMDMNLTQKKQGVRSGENLKPGDEHQIKDVELTRRKLMSQVHGIYDPLGLLSPTTIKFKLVLQKMVEAKLDWDDVLQGDLEKEARAALTEMVASGAIAFPRCVSGESYKEKGWMLMGFWDGGKPASACCLYPRTPLREKGPDPC